MDEATAFWVERPGVGALKAQRLPEPGERDVVVRTMHSAVSRGTETTVFTGHVPASERERMRAPFQEGEFGGPVKYGYLNVGRVVEGPQSLRGRVVFTLYPHQSAFVVPADAVVPVPDGVPARRAVLAGAVETAVNVLWDAAPLVGDRITVIGAGMIGCCIARLAQALPGSDVILIDTDESRRAIASRLGAGFATPSNAATGRDVVINASGSADGLQLALELAVTEGEVIEAGWYGDRPATLMLGADFHSRRLTIRSSQVGRVPPRRSSSRTTRDRLGIALALLRDPAFDSLLTARSSWRELPEVMTRMTDGSSTDLCHTIDWEDS